MTPLVPHMELGPSGHRYLWDGTHQGATLVPVKADVEALLDPLGDRPSDFEVCWERYGVTFDPAGNEIIQLGGDAPSTEPTPHLPRHARK